MRIWLFSSLVLLGCVPLPRAPLPLPPVVTRTLVAEGRFTPDERLDLSAASERLLVATGGRVDLKIVPGASWGQIRRHEPGDPWVEWADDHFGAKVYGWTDGNQTIHLIPARLGTDRIFVHTAMHELLHAIGVHHVSGHPRALMAPSSDGNAPLELSREDRAAIADALNCPPW